MAVNLPTYCMHVPALDPLASGAFDHPADSIEEGSPLDLNNMRTAKLQYSMRELLSKEHLATPTEVTVSELRLKKVESLHLDGATPLWAQQMAQGIQNQLQQMQQQHTELQQQMQQMQGQHAGLQQQMQGQHTELQQQMQQLQGQHAGLQQQMQQQHAGLQQQMQQQHTELQQQMQQQHAGLQQQMQQLQGQHTELQEQVKANHTELTHQIKQVSKRMENLTLRTATEKIQMLVNVTTGEEPTNVPFPETVEQLVAMSTEDLNDLLTFYDLGTHKTKKDALIAVKAHLGIKYI